MHTDRLNTNGYSRRQDPEHIINRKFSGHVWEGSSVEGKKAQSVLARWPFASLISGGEVIIYLADIYCPILAVKAPEFSEPEEDLN